MTAQIEDNFTEPGKKLVGSVRRLKRPKNIPNKAVDRVLKADYNPSLNAGHQNPIRKSIKAIGHPNTVCFSRLWL